MSSVQTSPPSIVRDASDLPPDPCSGGRPLDLLDSAGGLPSNQIHRLARDDHSRLWLAGPMGLACYDGSFIRCWDRSSGLQCSGLRSVAIDKNDLIWIGTDLGFEVLDESGRSLPGVAPGAWRFGLCQQILPGDRSIWIGCANGLVELVCISPEAGYQLAYHADTGFVSDLVGLGARRVIAASARDGLIESDGKTWWPYRTEALVNRRVTRIAVGNDGEILVGTDAGLYVIDDASGRLVTRMDPGNSDPQVTAIAVCAGQYWIAFGDILLRFSRDRSGTSIRERFRASSTINDLQVDAFGNIFIATNSSGLAMVSCLRDAVRRIDLGRDGGVYLIKRVEDDNYLIGGDRILGRAAFGEGATRFRQDSSGLPDTIVWDCVVDAQTTWVAAQAGLYRAPHGGKFERAFATDPVLGAPNRVLMQRDAELWVGTLRGLACIRGGEPQIIDAGDEPLGYVYAMHLDDQRALWICTLGRGLWREHHGLSPIVAAPLTATGNSYAIAQGPDGRYVVLQDEKLVLLGRDLTARLVMQLPPISGWTVAWVDARTVAVGSSAGLRFVDIESGQVVSLVQSLLPRRDWEFTNNRTLVRDSQGRFLCGVNGGLVRVDYHHLRSFAAPACQLVDVRWSGAQPACTSGVFMLEPGRWSFRLRACAAWFVDAPGVRFQFQLVGFDADWSTPETRAEVAFNSLPPGSYRLLCRAQSPLTGIGPEKELLQLVVRVPLWAMGWTTLLAGLESLYYRLVRARKQNAAMLERNRALEAAVAERTAALVTANQALEKVRDDYQKLSEVDELTGLGNRRNFEREIERAIALTNRLQFPLSLLIIDVDHFKAVNDRLGHQVGDQYLRAVGQVLASAIRIGEDVATRYGGEEFAMLLVNTGADGAHMTAERIRASVEALALRNDGAAGGVVTVSIGVAAVQPGQPTRRDDLLTRADHALYRAKDAGRNQVVAAM